MKRPLLFKTLAIGLLMLLLLIPIVMISDSIIERKHYSQSVVEDIARSSSYSQTITGPVLVVPYSKIVRTASYNEKNEKIIEESLVYGKLKFLPELFELNGDLKSELRKRGIYSARLYHSDNNISGKFLIPKDFGVVENLQDYTFEQAYLAIGINDIRGIDNSLVMKINEKLYPMEAGSKLNILSSGVHTKLVNLEFHDLTTLNFSLNLKLTGTESFSIVPIGKETRVNISSDWPHPKFVGNFLPVDSSISEAGFNANWQTSFFATNMQEYFLDCANKNDCTNFNDKNFGVNFIDPVNQYVKSDRAIKYAILFIGLTFACFFLFEIMKRLQVHPVQYSLVGLALAFFYLLLLSLSEHLGFNQAYVISAAACVSLIGIYVCFVLRSVLRGVGFTLGLSLLYGLLFGLLSAEDYALLMGSVLLFSILAAVMILTRNVNWYAIGVKSNSEVV
jgi:inner membrane protein